MVYWPLWPLTVRGPRPLWPMAVWPLWPFGPWGPWLLSPWPVGPCGPRPFGAPGLLAPMAPGNLAVWPLGPLAVWGPWPFGPCGPWPFGSGSYGHWPFGPYGRLAPGLPGQIKSSNHITRMNKLGKWQAHFKISSEIFFSSFMYGPDSTICFLRFLNYKKSMFLHITQIELQLQTLLIFSKL